MKSLIPRGKPKSLVISVTAGLIGLLVAGPSVYAGKILNWHYHTLLGGYLLIFCEVTFAYMWIVFMVGKLAGKYERIEEREWSQQVW